MTNNKEFDLIMHDITSGLTGDPNDDMPYLNEQCEKNTVITNLEKRLLGLVVV